MDGRSQVRYIKFNDDKLHDISEVFYVDALTVTRFHLYGDKLAKDVVGPFIPIDSAVWDKGLAGFTGRAFPYVISSNTNDKILSGYTIDSHNQAVAVATKEGKQEPGPSKVVFLGTSPHDKA